MPFSQFLSVFRSRAAARDRARAELQESELPIARKAGGLGPCRGRQNQKKANRRRLWFRRLSKVRSAELRAASGRS